MRIAALANSETHLAAAIETTPPLPCLPASGLASPVVAQAFVLVPVHSCPPKNLLLLLLRAWLGRPRTPLRSEEIKKNERSPRAGVLCSHTVRRPPFTRKTLLWPPLAQDLRVRRLSVASSFLDHLPVGCTHAALHPRSPSSVATRHQSLPLFLFVV